MTHLLKSDDYHTQKNNAHRPMYECGNTTAANAAMSATYQWRYDPGEPLDNYLYKLLRGPIINQFAKERLKSNWAASVPEQVPACLAYALTMITGEGHKLTYEADQYLISHALQDGIVLVTPTAFYNGKKNGHYVLTAGLWEKGVVIDDPLGNPLHGYKPGYSGYGVKVEWDTFLRNHDGIAVYRG